MEKIGKYEIVGELGKGATSVVYLARDPFADRQRLLSSSFAPKHLRTTTLVNDFTNFL